MGSWGKGSFENDSALDFIGDLINWKKVSKLVSKKKIDHYDYDEIRVSAEILINLHKINNLWTDSEIIQGLVRGLETIIADKEWYSTWRDERDAKAIVKQLKSFIRQLNQLDGY